MLKRLSTDPDGEREIMYRLQEGLMSELKDIFLALIEDSSDNLNLEPIIANILSFLLQNGF